MIKKKINFSFGLDCHSQININETWYFKHIIDNIEEVFKKDKNKIVLLRFPNNKRFYYINFSDYEKIKKTMEDVMAKYRNDFYFQLYNK